MPDAPPIAFLAEGKLFVKRGALAPQLLESPFAQGVLDRAAQSAERHGWRQKEPGNPFAGNLLWGQNQRPSDVRKVAITGLTRAPADDAGQILYALDTGAVGGLFTYDLAASAENRLFHKQEFRADDIACHPAKALLALSHRAEDGSASIAIMQPGTRKLTPVTEGDARDEAPAWVPVADEPQREVLLYQSAGIARNQAGHFINLGPYALQRLDLDRSQHAILLEDQSFDFLAPRARLENNQEITYFIRRPYKPQGHGNYTPLKLLKDILLFPFRLAVALFAFLNVMSVIFAKKPLTTAGGPKTEMDNRALFLHGQRIDAEKAIKAARGQPAALVPASWELQRMTADGKTTTLAAAVLAFDLAPDGSLVYTNGSEIFHLSADGKPARVCTHSMVQQIVALPSA